MSNAVMEMVRNVNQTKEFYEKFKDIKFPSETLKEILDAGRRAPSYHNRQNWKFVLVEDNTKDELYKRLNAYCTSYSNDISANTMKYLKESLKCIKDCNVFIILTMETDLFETSGINFSNIMSMGACVENMILMATERMLDVACIYIEDIEPVLPVMEEHLIDCCGIKLNNKRNKIVGGLCLGKEEEGVVKEQVPLQSIDSLTYKNDYILPVINLSDF